MKEKAYKNNESSTVICSGLASDPCPEKYICKHLAFFGICCPEETEGNNELFYEILAN